MTTLTDSEASICTVVIHTPCNESGHDNTDGLKIQRLLHEHHQRMHHK